MDCELCGNSGARYVVEVEGISMRVCETCSRPYEKKPLFAAKPVARNSGGFSPPARRPLISSAPAPQKKLEVTDLVPDWNTRIRRAREQHGWKIEEAALLLKEHASVIKRLEHGELKPSDAQIPRIEKVFGLQIRKPLSEED